MLGVVGLDKRALARIAVSAAVFSSDRPYTYLVPESLLDRVRLGMRVIVPFGRGNKRSEGIILSLGVETERENIKAIESVLDSEPVLSQEQMKLALWMRDRFFCTLYEAIRAMLPAGMWFRDGEKMIGDKTQKFVTIAVSSEDAVAAANQKKLRAPQQSAVLMLLASIGDAAVSDICHFTGAQGASITALEKQGLVHTEMREVLRSPMRIEPDTAEPVILNCEQEAAFSGLKKLMQSGRADAALLFGVTGSGKTAVYIKLVQETVHNGRSAIVLVPEIGLTPQFVEIFASHFGKRVALLHSSLTMGERYDEWKRIRSGEVKVVIGTRSAVFAPLTDIGLIIIDEEQEHTYKSENSPRYHTRDVAKYRCVQHNALLILGSATPSVDSMHFAKSGRYKLFSLEERYNEHPMPEVLIADMRQELRDGNASSISKTLKGELEKNIEKGEQSILFINRRGASSLVVCGECGFTYSCPNCSVSMTYHSVGRRLLCHYCGHTSPIPDACPECGGKLNFLGAGTQKVEEELRDLFPDIDVIRMDTDTVSRSGAHEKLLRRFREKKTPVLIGTQMVTKGLDFENVTLVGVLSADQSLYVSDFRAHERTFSLITQVVGRAGRGDKTGRAVIQTFTPENEVISLAAKQDYIGFFDREIQLRKLTGMPPVKDLFSITVSGINEAAVLHGCMTLRKSLEYYAADLDSIFILGPAPAAITKVSGRYRYKLSVSCENIRKIRDIIAHILREFASDRGNRGLSVFADADPME